ncbi:CPBP family intramembrane glutamic endopeptidase [Gilvimarinus sp. DA14]|uniref:CPBP family intramembrane glutamic endopeptidase n=1 Tax=Gilvimarinus sp. DA14 TaxID=2956798 RepID=UPI0020B786E2|nr:CPBP family intramembrane glutamic endopeptidase [Gilvimarinus sp. DA14]UTF60463.1 CPBP family intramembrane metalloprotease [Gilvimarinus sp. DA14]
MSNTAAKPLVRGLERPGDDFPFYAGQPVTISTRQWLMVLAAVALGFTCLTLNVPVLTGDPGILIRTLLFPAIPLAVLRYVAGPHWRSLFRRLRAADFGWMLAFALLNLVVSSLVGVLVIKLFGADQNIAVQTLADQSLAQREWFFLRSIPQLFGEEVLTILPLLAILYLGHQRLGLSRTKAVLLAWLLSSVIFGLVHLPSYNWNWLQCVLVIGTARLVLTLAYIKTKNILVSTGAHIINDWVIFGIVLLGATKG